jgi:hypothetical protein
MRLWPRRCSPTALENQAPIATVASRKPPPYRTPFTLPSTSSSRNNLQLLSPSRPLPPYSDRLSLMSRPQPPKSDWGAASTVCRSADGGCAVTCVPMDCGAQGVDDFGAPAAWSILLPDLAVPASRHSIRQHALRASYRFCTAPTRHSMICAEGHNRIQSCTLTTSRFHTRLGNA